MKGKKYSNYSLICPSAQVLASDTIVPIKSITFSYLVTKLLTLMQMTPRRPLALMALYGFASYDFEGS